MGSESRRPLSFPTHLPPFQSLAFLKGPSDKNTLDNVADWTFDDIKEYAMEKASKGLGPYVPKQQQHITKRWSSVSALPPLSPALRVTRSFLRSSRRSFRKCCPMPSSSGWQFLPSSSSFCGRCTSLGRCMPHVRGWMLYKNAWYVFLRCGESCACSLPNPQAQHPPVLPVLLHEAVVRGEARVQGSARGAVRVALLGPQGGALPCACSPATPIPATKHSVATLSPS